MRKSLPEANWLADSPTVSGMWPFMPWGEWADSLLMPMLGPSGEDGIALISSQAPGLSFTGLSNIDQGTRWSHIDLAATPIQKEDWFRTGDSRAADVHALAVAAEILGASRRCLDLSVEYAGVRSQFGRAIGTFQAVRHLCADMYVGIENANSVTTYAAAAIEAGLKSAGSAASVAAFAAHQVGTKVWTNALQVHGGIGFTWECELHLCIKRIMALQGVLGSPEKHSELLLDATL
jgi:alkylation response protein AidB-like acyl-CoA dehydrogenase